MQVYIREKNGSWSSWTCRTCVSWTVELMVEHSSEIWRRCMSLRGHAHARHSARHLFLIVANLWRRIRSVNYRNCIQSNFTNLNVHEFVNFLLGVFKKSFCNLKKFVFLIMLTEEEFVAVWMVIWRIFRRNREMAENHARRANWFFMLALNMLQRGNNPVGVSMVSNVS